MLKCTDLSYVESVELEKLSKHLKALSDPTRLHIVYRLREGERCVCEIYETLNLPQNLASHHLKVLKEAGIVEARRDGTWIRYRLNKKTIGDYQRMLARALRIK